MTKLLKLSKTIEKSISKMLSHLNVVFNAQLLYLMHQSLLNHCLFEKVENSLTKLVKLSKLLKSQFLKCLSDSNAVFMGEAH